ncbi:MAG: DoxX family protein [Myxococcales bacterium]|nr:DoxX family protein [Myxococcales bacterium]
MNRTNKILWIIQALLAALFLFAGAMKLAMPGAELAKQTPFPVAFIRFIGVAEVLGAIGLVVPGLTRIRTSLTPLAAIGLTIIMIGAVISTVAIGPAAPAVFPLFVGALAAFVAYGRNRLAPLPR